MIAASQASIRARVGEISAPESSTPLPDPVDQTGQRDGDPDLGLTAIPTGTRRVVQFPAADLHERVIPSSFGGPAVLLTVEGFRQRRGQRVEHGGDHPAPGRVITSSDRPGRPVWVGRQRESSLPEGTFFVIADLCLVAGLDSFGVEEFFQPAAEPAQPDRVQAGAGSDQGRLAFGPLCRADILGEVLQGVDDHLDLTEVDPAAGQGFPGGG